MRVMLNVFKIQQENNTLKQQDSSTKSLQWLTKKLEQGDWIRIKNNWQLGMHQ